MKVIITGASKGIGRGIATFLAREGFELGLLARSKDKLDDLERELRKNKARCETAPCDLRDPAGTREAIASLIERLGGIDALVNNAGLVIRKNVFEIADDDWHAMIDTNVNGLFHATRAVLPVMREQGHGHIINISSISGKVPLPGGSGYAASKFAVTGFSQSLFQEVRDFGIKVTVIYPGSVERENGETSWKVQPEQIGQAIRDVVSYKGSATLSEIEIRSLNRPPA